MKSDNGNKFDPGIDEHQLDKEWVNQPRMYYKYAKMAADARMASDQAKSQLEVVEADVARSIRNEPGSYGLSKITENAIKETIPLQRDYQEALAKVIETRHHMDVVNAAVAALDHRKKALEKLVELHNASYYATPRSPSGTKEDRDDAGMREIAERTKRKRKVKSE